MRLRLHHRGRFVNEPVHLYVGGEVTEMNWKFDVDFMSYMDLEALVKGQGYIDIGSLWYRNPKFSFTRGLRPLNNDRDVLQFGQDVVGHEVIDVYVEHKVSDPPEIVDPSELDKVIEDDDVELIGVAEPNIAVAEHCEVEPETAEHEPEPEPNIDVVETAEHEHEPEPTEPNIAVAEPVEQEPEIVPEPTEPNIAEPTEPTEPNIAEPAEPNIAEPAEPNIAEPTEPNIAETEDVVPEPEIFEPNIAEQGPQINAESQPNNDFSEDSNNCEDSGECDEMDWTSVLPPETLGEEPSVVNLQSQSEDEEDEEHLYTPPGTDDEEDQERFPTYKSGQGLQFKIGLMFSNKETIRDAIKEYGMENQKNVYIRKNDAKRIIVKCMDGCKFHLRFSLRNGQQYWQIVSYESDHTCCRTADNRNAKTQWLAIRFTQLLRHSPYMKPAGLVAEALQRWGIKISRDQAYRAKRRALDLIQGAGYDQFRHLRSYGEELLKSNPKSTVIIKCSENHGSPAFERIYICLDACKSGFAKYCRPIIGLDACFLKGDYGGQLMSAIGRDANNQIYPIAYAVVEAETKDSWEWFLHILLEDLRAVNDRCYGFISDQQKVTFNSYLCFYL